MSASTGKAQGAIRKSSREYMALMREISAPYTETAKFAMPRLRGLISRYGSDLNREDPQLRAMHERNIGGIGQAEAAGLASSERMSRWTGNTGRFRGEQFRIRMAGEKARGEESLSYASTQRSVKDAALARYQNALALASNVGAQGIQPMVSGGQAVMEGTQNAAMLQAQTSMANTAGYMNLLGVGLSAWLGK